MDTHALVLMQLLKLARSVSLTMPLSMEAAMLIQLAQRDSISAMEFASTPVPLVEISINSQETVLIVVTQPTTTWPTEVASGDQSLVQQDNGKLTTLATTSLPLATPSIPIQDSASPASAIFTN